MRSSLRSSVFALPVLAAASVLAPTTSALALDEAERTALRAEIRAYLLENPEVLAEAFAVLQNRETEAVLAKEKALIAEYSNAIYFDQHSLVRGNPSGGVTLVEFRDYRCGFCKRAHPKILDIVAKDGDIRHVVKEFPILGEQSDLAAQAALAALQLAPEKADAFQEALMGYDGALNEQVVLALAQEAGFDGAQLKAGMNDPAIKDWINLNKLLASILNINGTPAFAIGSTLIRGDLPAADIVAAVQQAREGKEPGFREPPAAPLVPNAVSAALRGLPSSAANSAAAAAAALQGAAPSITSPSVWRSLWPFD